MIAICDSDMRLRYMPLDVRGLIGRWTGNRNIASVKGKALGDFTYMRYAICDDVTMRLQYRIGEKIEVAGQHCDLRFAISHRRRSNGCGEGS